MNEEEVCIDVEPNEQNVVKAVLRQLSHKVAMSLDLKEDRGQIKEVCGNKEAIDIFISIADSFSEQIREAKTRWKNDDRM